MKDEVASLAATKSIAGISVAISQRSKISSSTKTYISKLEKRLDEEKVARRKLEDEVAEMKRINAEISSKLGLTSSSQQEGKAE